MSLIVVEFSTERQKIKIFFSRIPWEIISYNRYFKHLYAIHAHVNLKEHLFHTGCITDQDKTENRVYEGLIRTEQNRTEHNFIKISYHNLYKFE